MLFSSNSRISFQERLGGKWAGSSTSWLLFIPFALITTLNFDGTREFHTNYQIYLLAILIHFFTGLVFFAGRHTLLSRRNEYAVPVWRVLVVFALAALVRIVSADLLSDYFAGENQPILERSVSFPFSIVTFVVITLALDSIDRQFRELKSLSSELKRLEFIKTEAFQYLNTYQNELLKTVTNQIMPALNRLEKMYIKLIESKEVTSAELRFFTETVKEWNQVIIRAISHMKYEKPLSKFSIPVNTQTDSFATSIRLNSLTKSWNFYPTVIWLPYLIISFALSYTYSGLRVGLMAIFVHIIGNLIFIFGQFYLRPRLPKYTATRRLTYISWIYTIYGLGVEATFIVILPTNSNSNIGVWVFFFPIWSLLGMLVSGIIYGITGEGGRLQEQSVKEILDYRASAGNSLKSIRKIQKIFLDTVHGRIQSKFTAAALIMETTANENQSKFISPDALDKLNSQLNQLVIEATKDLTNLTQWTESEPKSIESILLESKKNWLELVDIDLDIDDDSKEILNGNSWLRSAFEDIVNESITNAVRHGSANQVKIIAKVDSKSSELKLLVTNNGVSMKNPLETSGIGFSTLRDLGITVNLNSEKDKITLEVSVPLFQKTNNSESIS